MLLIPLIFRFRIIGSHSARYQPNIRLFERLLGQARCTIFYKTHSRKYKNDYFDFLKDRTMKDNFVLMKDVTVRRKTFARVVERQFAYFLHRFLESLLETIYK